MSQALSIKYTVGMFPDKRIPVEIYFFSELKSEDDPWVGTKFRIITFLGSRPNSTFVKNAYSSV